MFVWKGRWVPLDGFQGKKNRAEAFVDKRETRCRVKRAEKQHEKVDQHCWDEGKHQRFISDVRMHVCNYLDLINIFIVSYVITYSQYLQEHWEAG